MSIYDSADSLSKSSPFHPTHIGVIMSDEASVSPSRSFSMKKFFKVLAGITVGLTMLSIVCFNTCFKFVDSYHLAYNFNKWEGKTIKQINHTGYVLSVPFYNEVTVVDMRPMQVCISANGRVLNCKLVKFNPLDSGKTYREKRAKELGLSSSASWSEITQQQNK